MHESDVSSLRKVLINEECENIPAATVDATDPTIEDLELDGAFPDEAPLAKRARTVTYSASSHAAAPQPDVALKAVANAGNNALNNANAIANAQQKRSSKTHHNEWERFMSAVKNLKKFPISLTGHCKKDRLDLFGMFLDIPEKTTCFLISS